MNSLEKFSKRIGYLFGYFMFTTVLYFIFYILNKLPEWFNYGYIMLITALIVAIGMIAGKLLDEKSKTVF